MLQEHQVVFAGVSDLLLHPFLQTQSVPFLWYMFPRAIYSARRSSERSSQILKDDVQTKILGI
jgi:hypothetical protein